jgi:hypothetical protein
VHHFGFGALVLLGGFVELELVSTHPALLLLSGEFGCLGSFPVPLLLRSLAPLSCKPSLLLLGIVGLAAALLEFKEGHVTFPV